MHTTDKNFEPELKMDTIQDLIVSELFTIFQKRLLKKLKILKNKLKRAYLSTVSTKKERTTSVLSFLVLKSTS